MISLQGFHPPHRYEIIVSKAQQSIALANRFSVLNSEEDCTLTSHKTPKDLQNRRITRNAVTIEDPNQAWSVFSISYHAEALNWYSQGEIATSKQLASMLNAYLQTLSLESARHLHSIHCKEILIAALILPDEAPLKQCIALKLHQYLAPAELASLMALVIEVNNSNFLSLLGGSTEIMEDKKTYNNGLFYALKDCKFACLQVLLTYIHPDDIDSFNHNDLNIDIQTMLNTLFSYRQTYLQKSKNNDLHAVENFSNCLALLIDLNQALSHFQRENPIPDFNLFNQPTSAVQLNVNAKSLSSLLNRTSSKEDQKAILALFLEKGWLTSSFCKEYATLSKVYSDIQSLRRSKNTKKALANA